MQRWGMFRHFRGCWGFGVCKGIRKGRGSKQAPRTCYAVTGKVREQQCTKLRANAGAQHTLDSLFCPLLLLHISSLCCLWCFYFWKHGDWKKKSQIHNALQGIVSTQTKNSPQPPSHLPLILSRPNCGCSHPGFTSSGRERERGGELRLWLRTDHPVFP